MALQHGLTAIRTQARPPPPSTISTASSSSSNATVKPTVYTPRATSPTSKVPYVGKLTHPPSTTTRTRQNPHWVASTSNTENTAIVNAKTVLAGFKWRLEQYLDISPPYGLIIPEMVEAARQDMEITGPALDFLASAVTADDGDPPVCELPFVQEDASGRLYCNHTIPITVKTSPDVTKPIFEAWSRIVVRVRALEPRFYSEVARIICELDTLQNVINPQVTKLAADIRKTVEEFKEKREYITFIEEKVKIALGDGRVSIIGPSRTTTDDRIVTLDDVREENESVTSSSSSRSASRASRRSLSRARSTNSLRNNHNVNGDRLPTASGVRPRASNTSLRIDKEGRPLGDDEAEGGDRGAAARSNELNGLPRAFVVPPTPRHQEHWSAPSAQYDGSEISNDQSDIYGNILPQMPLSIPAYSDNPQKNSLLDISKLTIQSHSAPVSPSGPDPPMAFTRIDSTSSPSARGRQLPRPPGSSGNSPLTTVGSVSVVGTPPARSIQGPRPLPTRPSRSPQPGGPNGMTSANVPSTTGPIMLPEVGSFVVPDQSSTSTSNMRGGSSAMVDISAFSVPSNLSDTLEVPSSSSDYDLQNARRQYLQSSLTQPSLSRSSSKRRDVDRHNARVRLEYGDAARPSSAESAPPAPMNARLRDYASIERLQGNSSFQQPLHPSASLTQLGRIPGESNWGAPSSWKDPPVVVPSETNNSHSRPTGGIFKGVRDLIKSRHHPSSDSSKDEDAPPLPPKGTSPRSSADAPTRPVNTASYQSSPDSALAYYYGAVPPTPPHHYTTEGQVAYSSPTSAPARAQSFQPVGSTVVEGNVDRVDTQQRFAHDYPLTSPGYAEAYQRNPVAAESYNGAGSSASRPGLSHNASGRSYNSLYNGGPYENFSHPINSYSHTSTSNNQPLHMAPSVPSSTPMQPPTEKKSTPDQDTIRQTMYGAVAEALATEALRDVTVKDPQRAFFSAMCLAILNVSVTLQDPTQDTPNLVTMMGRQIRLTDLPGAYKTCMTELAAVGREARKLSVEDDERAIAYVARGKSLPEPRLGRVRKLLERGMGYVDATGHVRGSSHNSGGTGRSREFSTKITALSLEMMKLPDFQGQQELFKIFSVAR